MSTENLRDQLFADPLWEAMRQDTGLSEMEIQVVRFMCMGLSIKGIALMLHRSPKTPEGTRLRAAEKLHATGTAEIVAKALPLVFEKYLEAHRE